MGPTVRRIGTGDVTYTVTDTVGFVRHLAPPEWVDALCRVHPGAVAVSARTGAGIDHLRAELARRVRVH
ncbi:hypothetical protein ACWD69_25815 [Micromonospora chokoriensis]